MPKTAKAFDCVAMKNAIQARLLPLYEKGGADQVKQALSERLQGSKTDIAAKWKRIKGGGDAAKSRVA